MQYFLNTVIISYTYKNENENFKQIGQTHGGMQFRILKIDPLRHSWWTSCSECCDCSRKDSPNTLQLPKQCTHFKHIGIRTREKN